MAILTFATCAFMVGFDHVVFEIRSSAVIKTEIIDNYIRILLMVSLAQIFENVSPSPLSLHLYGQARDAHS